MEIIIMTLEKVKKILADHLEMDEAEINADTTLDELGVDSLDAVEIVMELEDEFGIEIQSDEIGNSVKDFVDYIESKLD